MAHDVADDVCDSWEDMIENGVLEKKLEELQMKVPKNNSLDDRSSNCDPIPQLRLEDPCRTPYVPQLKILKRPSDAKSGIVGSGAEKSPTRQPMKTLQQREAEYAEARLRILGSASSEDENQKPGSIPQLTLAAVERKNEPEVTIIRLPLGPDGTRGFFQHR